MYLPQHARNITTLLFLVLSLSRITAQAIPDTVECAPSTQTSTQLSLLFVGDFMQHVAQIEAAQTDSGYCYNDCWQYVRDEISRADIAVGNFETTLGGKPYSGYPSFSAPDEFFTSLVDAGFDIFLTSNNHSLDTGKRGIERTISQMNKVENIAQVGTYIDRADRDKRYPYIFEKNGIKIALLNYTYGTNGLTETAPNIVNRIDTTIIAQDIAKAQAASPDAIIACMHWGVEYKQQPDKNQQSIADWLLAHGVDHIIGSHPHVIQPLELRQDSTGKEHLIVYSLGNYISNMKIRATDGGMMVRLVLEKDSSITRVADCGYSLVYTARPVKSGKKNFELIPAARPREEYSDAVKQGMQIFLDDTRKLLKTSNVAEYTF